MRYAELLGAYYKDTPKSVFDKLNERHRSESDVWRIGRLNEGAYHKVFDLEELIKILYFDLGLLVYVNYASRTMNYKLPGIDEEGAVIEVEDEIC